MSTRLRRTQTGRILKWVAVACCLLALAAWSYSLRGHTLFVSDGSFVCLIAGAMAWGAIQGDTPPKGFSFAYGCRQLAETDIIPRLRGSFCQVPLLWITLLIAIPANIFWWRDRPFSPGTVKPAATI